MIRAVQARLSSGTYRCAVAVGHSQLLAASRAGQAGHVVLRLYGRGTGRGPEHETTFAAGWSTCRSVRSLAFGRTPGAYLSSNRWHWTARLPSSSSCCRCSSPFDAIAVVRVTGSNSSSFSPPPHRPLHTSCTHLDTKHSESHSDSDAVKSKAEQLLKHLREQLASEAERSVASTSAHGVGATPAGAAPKKSLWQRFKDECAHYWHGTKLLGIDIRVSCRLLWQVLRGHTLTRRERRQLVRTTSDLFRLVPFSVFVIVPFMEFTLPFFLKLFPGMLPSTYQEQSREDEKLRKQLKVRLEMAKFLQETLEELALERGGKGQAREGQQSTRTQEFAKFLKQIRAEGGGYVSNVELLKFSKLFEDELTLDNLSAQQLRALCRIVAMQPMGPANILRFQLRLKLRELRADDALIAQEGVDSLTVPELQAACRARGMRAVGKTEEQLRAQLASWLELSLDEKVPPSLLLLSRTLFLPEEMDFKERLRQIVQELPEKLATEATLQLAELESGKVDNKARIELVRSIEAAIKRERAELDQARKAAEAEALAAAAKAAAPVATATAGPFVEPVVDLQQTAGAAKRMEEVLPEDLRQLEQVLDVIQGARSEDTKDIAEFKEDVQEHKEDVAEVKSLATRVAGGELRESKAARRLQARVDRLISSMDRLYGRLYTQKQQLTPGPAEPATESEAAPKAAATGAGADELREHKEHLISINELLLALRRLQKLPDSTKEEKILDVLRALDIDKDGAIDVNIALEVIDVLGQENVKISKERMAEITEMLRKEDLLEQQTAASAADTAATGDSAKQLKDRAKPL